MPVPVLAMNYTLNRKQSSNTFLALQNKSAMVMPFNLKSSNNNSKTVVGLELKPSKAYKGCGGCGRG